MQPAKFRAVAYIEDTTEGMIDGKPYWRRGRLGYSNIDRRYEWVTIGPQVPIMTILENRSWPFALCTHGNDDAGFYG